MTDASVLSNTNIALQNSETVLRKFKKILYRGSCVQSTGRGVGFNVQEILVTLGRKLCVFHKFQTSIPETVDYFGFSGIIESRKPGGAGWLS